MNVLKSTRTKIVHAEIKEARADKISMHVEEDPFHLFFLLFLFVSSRWRKQQHCCVRAELVHSENISRSDSRTWENLTDCTDF